MSRAEHRFDIRGLWLAAWLLMASLGFTGAAWANPLPPPYRDFPTGPSDLVSRVTGPVLADDFALISSGRVRFVEWWGSATSARFALTLYANTDAAPAAPDAGGASLEVTRPHFVEA